MRIDRVMAPALAGIATLALVACGSADGIPPGSIPETAPAETSPAAPAKAATGRLTDWPMFGLSASRPSATNASPGITAAAVSRLRRIRVRTPGTVDSAPVILGNTAFATTAYGKTIAVGLARGTIRWTFTPAVAGRVAGSYQITHASPAADPSRRFIYAASPDGAIHKLSVADGREQPGWPVVITKDPAHEKLSSSLNVSGNWVVATTGGYYGDAPPYQGKVVTIDRGTGKIANVFNSLCSDRHEILEPSSCAASDSAIWGRGGAVVLPGSRDLLVTSSNGPFDGVRNWSDSVLRLTPDAGRLLRHWTPTDEATLSAGDVDVGSASPAYLGNGLVLQGGKDAKLRLLSLSRLYGVTGTDGPRLGGEIQVLPTPGDQPIFTAPAVWHQGSRTIVFVTTGGGTTAYAVRGGRLKALWGNGHAGTSPIVAGGLLYVYDPGGGGLRIYRAATGRIVGRLDAGAGHWNSPAVASGHLVVAEGDANDHIADAGLLDVWNVR